MNETPPLSLYFHTLPKSIDANARLVRIDFLVRNPYWSGNESLRHQVLSHVSVSTPLRIQKKKEAPSVSLLIR